MVYDENRRCPKGGFPFSKPPQLLRNVEPQWQAGQLRRASHAEGVGEGDGLQPFDIGFAGLCARYIDAN